MSANHIFSTITTEQSNLKQTAELCLNWWPTPSLSISIPGMPHPLCHTCANWLPDIEDIGIIHNNSTCYSKKVRCGNYWSKEKNKPLNENEKNK